MEFHAERAGVALRRSCPACGDALPRGTLQGRPPLSLMIVAAVLPMVVFILYIQEEWLLVAGAVLAFVWVWFCRSKYRFRVVQDCPACGESVDHPL